jgi:hypothetical protein
LTFPSLYALVAQWSTEQEKTRCITVVVSGSSIGACLVILLAPLVMEYQGWDVLFLGTGYLGLAWLIAWWITVPEEARFFQSRANAASKQHSSETSMEVHDTERPALDTELEALLQPEGEAAEAEAAAAAAAAAAKPQGESDGVAAPRASGNVSLRWALSQPELLALVVGHFSHNWTMYTLLSWLPTYVNEVLGERNVAKRSPRALIVCMDDVFKPACVQPHTTRIPTSHPSSRHLPTRHGPAKRALDDAETRISERQLHITHSAAERRGAPGVHASHVGLVFFPYLTMGITGMLGGWTTDVLVGKGVPLLTVRKMMAVLGMICAMPVPPSDPRNNVRRRRVSHSIGMLRFTRLASALRPGLRPVDSAASGSHGRRWLALASQLFLTVEHAKRRWFATPSPLGATHSVPFRPASETAPLLPCGRLRAQARRCCCQCSARCARWGRRCACCAWSWGSRA